MWLLSLIIFFSGLLMLLSGRFVRRNMLFGIFVPDDYRELTEVQHVIQTFRIRIMITALLFAVIDFIFNLILKENDNVSFLLFFVLLNLLILIDLWFYKSAYDEIRRLKAGGQWMRDIKVVKATDTSLRSDLHLLPKQLYIIPFGIILFSAMFTAFHYNEIPDRFAVHWGINNQPDRWEDKSFWSVYSGGMIGLVTIGILMAVDQSVKIMPMMLNPSAKEASSQYEVSVRRNNSYLMFIIALIMSLLFSFIMLQPLIYKDDHLPNWFLPITLAAIFIPIIVSVMVQVKADRDYRHTAATTDKAPYHNDDFYKWGLFYYNKDDENVFVPKVSQFGMTLNFARKEAIFLTILFLVLTLLPIIIIEIFVP